MRRRPKRFCLSHQDLGIETKQLWNCPGAMTDERRLPHQLQGPCPDSQTKAGGNRDVARHNPLGAFQGPQNLAAEITRGRPQQGGNEAQDNQSSENALPTEMPRSKQQKQHREHGHRCAGGCNVAHARDKHDGKNYHSHCEGAASRAQLQCGVQEDECADDENPALSEIILDRNTQGAPTPRQTGEQHQRPRHQKQRGCRCQKSKQDPPAPIAAVELGQ